MPIVLDASVALTWCFPDEADDYAGRVLDLLTREDAYVPSIWSLEVANVLLSGERRQRIVSSDVSNARAVLDGLPIVMQPISLAEALGPVAEIMRSTGLTAYDAAYAHLARRMGAPLATLDRRLRDAAESLGCHIFYA
ncbi:MAG: type II toxin-antitoxin system VapC family toxin [Dehalococcoidia bacterium]